MITVEDKTASMLIGDMERLGQENAPWLTPKIQELKETIYSAYAAKGRPLVGGEDDAMKWFDEVWSEWQRFNQDQQTAEAKRLTDAGMEQLVQLGDYEMRDGKAFPTPKGIARLVVGVLSGAIAQADENATGFSLDDTQMMTMLLMHCVAQLFQSGVVQL